MFHRDDDPEREQADFEMAQQGRLGGGGLVAIVYWLARGVQGLAGLIGRAVRRS